MTPEADRCDPRGFVRSGDGGMAQGPAAKVFIGGVDANIMGNIHEIFKADSSMTCQHGVPANMDVVAEFDPASIGDDYVWIDPDPRAERKFTAVYDNGGAVDQDIFAESGETESF